MADLLLRRGTLANLDNTARIDGAINIVTDERAIYIDVKNGNTVDRRRIGDFVVVDTWQELMTDKTTGTPINDANKQKLWSTTALYYVGGEENALLRWTGTKWVQINTSAELESIVNNLQSTVTNLNNNYDSLEDRVDKAEKAITAEEKAREATDQKVTEIEEDYKAADEKLKGLIDAITGGVDGDLDLTGLQNQITQNAEDIKTNKQNIATNTAEIEKLKGGKEVEGSVENKIDKAIQESESKTNAEIVKQVQSEANEREGAIDALRDELTGEDGALNSLEKKLEEKIVSELEAADAMRFRGVIGDGDGSTYSNLPTTGVEAGDTYKVGTPKRYGSTKTGESGIYSPGKGPGNGQYAYVGDLFIAIKDQDSDEYEYTWAYIEAGYAESYDPKLVINKNDKSIDLQNHLNASKGKVSFKAKNTNSNLVIEVDDDNAFTFGLVWQSFTGETE